MTPETNLPPDHATSRIVAELAAALLPHLKETVSAELARTLGSAVSVTRRMEEALSSLENLRVTFEDIAKKLDSAQEPRRDVSDETPLPPRAREAIYEAVREAVSEALNDAAARLGQTAAEPAGTAKIDDIMRSAEAAFSDWEGILKANGRAQTKELSDFSAEVSELLNGMSSNLPAALNKSLEQALLPRAEAGRAYAENLQALETRLANLEKIEKIIFAEGFVVIILSAVIAVMLFL